MPVEHGVGGLQGVVRSCIGTDGTAGQDGPECGGHRDGDQAERDPGDLAAEQDFEEIVAVDDAIRRLREEDAQVAKVVAVKRDSFSLPIEPGGSRR